MARKTKPGLDYFSFDVDFFEDDKIELISSEFGPKGESIAIRLLCKIYRNGYYYLWGKDESLLFAKRVGNGITGALVDEVVQGLIKRSFFDKGVFDSFMILTSKGIQTRYIDAKERAKEVVFFKEYQLISNNVLNKWNNVVIKSVNEHTSTQIREEKRKEEREEISPPGFLEEGLIWNIEDDLLKNQISFEKICTSAGKNRSVGEFSLKKYHLWLQGKSGYPKARKALYSSFQLWLMGEKEEPKNMLQKTGPTWREIEEQQNRKKLGL